MNDFHFTRKTYQPSAHLYSLRKACYPYYSSLEKRIQSFAKRKADQTVFRENSALSPFLMGQAGFFALGKNKCVCFQCGGGLQRFKPDFDKPFIEHCRHYPSCDYVNLILGSDFVLKVRHHFQIKPARRNVSSLIEPVIDRELLSKHNDSWEYRAVSSFYSCQLCLSTTINSVLIPCGHMVFCTHCIQDYARDVGRFSNPTCPICDFIIFSHVPLFTI